MSDALRLRGGQARSVWARLQLWWYTAPVVLIGLVLLVCTLSAWLRWGTIGACLYVLMMTFGLWCGWPIHGRVFLRAVYAREWFLAARASGLVKISESDVDRLHDNLGDDFAMARAKKAGAEGRTMVGRMVARSYVRSRAERAAPREVAPALMRLRVSPGRRVYQLRPLPGQTVEDYEDACGHLVLRWRAASVRARPCRGGPLSRGRIELTVILSDPLAKPIDATPRGIPKPVAVPSAPVISLPGMTEDGSRPSITLGLHTLVAGSTGGGKSSGLRALLCELAPRDDVQLVLIDPKWVEFAQWKRRPRVVACSPEQIEEVLTLLVAEMEWRYQLMAQQGVTSWSSRLGPWIVGVADEVADVYDFPRGNRSPELLDALGRKARACGISLVMATQRPMAGSTISSSLRGNLSQRVVYRCDNHAATEFCLPGRADDFPAHELSLDEPGRCFLLGADGRVVEARIGWIDPEAVAFVDARTAHLCDIPDDVAPTAHHGAVPVLAPRATREDNERSEASARREAPLLAPEAQPAALLDLLDAIDRRGKTSKELSALLGLPPKEILTLCAELARTGQITRGGDNRWRLTA
jgi:hypothetical protein